MPIVVHGSLAFDRIMTFPGRFKDNILPDKIHNLNVSFYIDHMDEMRGGTGGNVVYSLALLEQRPILVSSIGKDGDSYLEFLKQHQIDMSGVRRVSEAATATASIITDLDNNQITAFFVGAAAYPAAFNFMTLPTDTIAIFNPANNKPDTLRFIDQCQSANIRYIFDPGQTTPDFNGKELKEIINGAYMLTVNDYELALIMKKTGLTEQNLLERVQVLIVTLGKKGSVIKTNDKEIIDIPALRQDTMADPTGAGDAYRAGLLTGLVNNLELEQCGRLAACAASYSIEHIGTQSHTFTMQDFRQRYQESFEEVCPV